MSLGSPLWPICAPKGGIDAKETTALKYTCGEKLGSGSYGSVFKARRDGSEVPVAIKVFELSRDALEVLPDPSANFGLFAARCV